VYLRGAADSVAAGAERDAEGALTVPSRLFEAAAGALSAGGRGLMEPGPAAQYGARCASATSGEVWVRVASRSSWVPPDTIPPIPGWRDSSTVASSILPLGRAKTGYAVAVPVDGHSCLVRLLLQPLNKAVVERYKRIIGCDVILKPTSRLGGSKLVDRVEVGVNEPSGMWADAPAVATVPKEDDAGLLHKSLYHGISELQLPRGAGGGSEVATIVAFIMVRTSLAELGSALYSLGGMNSVVVIVLSIMTTLMLVAVLISTLLGFSLSRSITSSVAALKRGTERLRKGNLDTTIHVRAKDELGTLADSFNQMTSDLRRMVQEVARRERLAREIQIAREIQVNMLPGELPKVEGYELAGASSPAFEVAGDYYDAVLLDQDRLAVVVADVSGKGVAAAMLMSNLQASLNVLLQQRRPLHGLAERLNLLTCRNSTPDMFITLFVGVIDLKSGELEYVNSGHDPPVIVRDDGAADLHSTGLVLGVLPDAGYRLARAALQPGDCLVLYSDGIIDAMNDVEEHFGRERLMAALRELRGNQASAIMAGIMRRVREHVGTSGAPKDDLTLLVVKICDGIPRRGDAPSQKAAS
jgi:serine phosphatase RsbU (regulator of sigma subunit)